jgi:hypothetical protein
MRDCFGEKLLLPTGKERRPHVWLYRSWGTKRFTASCKAPQAKLQSAASQAAKCRKPSCKVPQAKLQSAASHRVSRAI